MPDLATFRCRCVWNDERCPNAATQEDGLCDWCGPRTAEQIMANPKGSDAGGYITLGGGGERHVNIGRRPDACWMPSSGATRAQPGEL